MKYNEYLVDIARDLINLDINIKKRRELIKETHTCTAIIYGFPEVLENAAEEAKKNNLKQEEAYNYLKESIRKYDNRIASEINNQKYSPSYSYDQSGF
jgi:hypothetical protein